MSTYDEFFEMAQEMLGDPDIFSQAEILVPSSEPDPSKPWELPGSTSTIHSVTCFYYKPKNNMVNGTVIVTGQKAVLVQTEVPKASLLLATWKDANGDEWQIKTFEAIELNDKVIYYKFLIGS
mgnify:CR=1 FL=1